VVSASRRIGVASQDDEVGMSMADTHAPDRNWPTDRSEYPREGFNCWGRHFLEALWCFHWTKQNILSTEKLTSRHCPGCRDMELILAKIY